MECRRRKIESVNAKEKVVFFPLIMADRKAELEAKRQRLKQIREEKERRRQEKERLDAENAAKALGGPGGSGGPTSATTSKDPSPMPEIDRVLADYGIASVNRVLDSAASLPPTSASASTGSSLDPNQASMQRDASLSPKSQRPKTLSVVSVQSTNIPPKESVTYAKQTQTVESGPDVSSRSRGGGGLDYYTLTYDDPDENYEEDSIPGMGSGGSPSSGSPTGYLSKLPPGFLPTGMPEVKDVRPAVTRQEEEEAKAAKAKEKADEEKRRMEMSEEEKMVIMMSEDFHRFFDRSARLVERALCEEPNLFVDYTGAYDGDNGENGDGDKVGLRLALNRYFYDERWTKNRVVTSMDWSVAFPELLVASYDKNVEYSAHDPDGVCLVWNTRFKKTTPEHVFHCQSPVTVATFARFHPNLIIGGTYSGQVVLWDNRVQKRTPVQRSPLSAAAHTHPVFCMRVVGTQNAHNLISISTDGRLCSWSLDMLSQPQETLELQQHKQSKAVAVTSLAFPSGDVNNFIVGSEEGTVYTACRHGSRAGVLDSFEGHAAPVTGLSTHNGQGPVDFSHLFLTSSIDWTVKLWSLKENRPLYSFEDNGDYVYDVAWSPVHPALFAAVDGTGRLDLWHLNSDTEVATASTVVEGAPALNRVSWTQSGLHVTAGDDSGKIWVYDVGETLAIPAADEWAKFAHTLQDIKNNKAEEDLDKMASGSAGGGVTVVPGQVSSSGPGSLPSLSSLSSSPLR